MTSSSATNATRRTAATSTLRAAVIGSGGISAQHLGYLRDSARADLVGVCDLSPITARYAGEFYGTAGIFTDAAQMIAETRPDVVHVLTPPSSHVGLALSCLDAGAHVLVEKPAAPTLPELHTLLDKAAAADRHVIENHNYRFNDGVVALADAVAAGRLGTVREVEIRMALDIRSPGGRFADENLPNGIHKMPAGVVHDFITHLTYLLDHFTSHVDWQRIAAGWSNHGGGDLFTVDDLDCTLIGHGPEGAVHGKLRFSALTGPEQFMVTVRGSEGFGVTELFQPYVELNVPRAGGGQLSPIANHIANGRTRFGEGFRNVGRKLMQRSPYHGLHQLLDDTYAALADGTEPPVTPEQMIRTASIIDAILDPEVRV